MQTIFEPTTFVLGQRLKADRVKYAALQPREVLGALFHVLKLRDFDGVPDFEVFHETPYVSLFKCMLPTADDTVEAEFCLFLRAFFETEWSKKAQFFVELSDLKDKIVEYDTLRAELVDLHSDDYLEQLRELLRDKLTTEIDHDHDFTRESDDSGDEVASDDDGETLDERLATAKRPRKYLYELGLSRDTKLQKIDLAGVELRPACGLQSSARKCAVEKAAPAVAELLLDVCCRGVFRAPQPTAATFSSGATLLTVGGTVQFSAVDFALGDDAGAESVVSAKLLESDLGDAYLLRQQKAHDLRELGAEIVGFLQRVFTVKLKIGDHCDGYSLMPKPEMARALYEALSEPEAEDVASESEPETESESEAESEADDASEYAPSDDSGEDSDASYASESE